jgi:hypothetical protein
MLHFDVTLHPDVELHELLWVVGQGVPPFRAAVVAVNVRCRVPVPQEVLHKPHPFHEPAQFTLNKEFTVS